MKNKIEGKYVITGLSRVIDEKKRIAESVETSLTFMMGDIVQIKELEHEKEYTFTKENGQEIKIKTTEVESFNLESGIEVVFVAWGIIIGTKKIN